MSLNTLFRNLSCSARPALSRALTTRVRPSPDPRGAHLLPTAPSDRPLIPNTDSIHTPADFLKAIGRSVDTKVSPENWEDFWQKTTGRNLKSSGLGVRDRRYVLWCMEKYRQGLPVKSFAHEPTPKKTIRGWGPAVQNGKRIRSRRVKSTPTLSKPMRRTIRKNKRKEKAARAESQS